MSRNQAIVVLAVLLIVSAVSCKQVLVRDNPLAKVGDKVLYAGDVPAIYPEHVSEEDSLLLLHNYVQSWVGRQLLLQVAEDNLSSKQKDLTKELEDYRATLLIYRYKQQYVDQKMDTLVSQELIERFYADNKDRFVLTQPIVRVLFIKLPKDSPQLEQIRRLYSSTKQDELSELEKICMQAAVRYDYFNEQWLPMSVLTKELPAQLGYEEQVKQYKRIEVKDGQYAYLVAIRDYRPKGTIAPLEYQASNIRAVLLNQRKLEMMDKLEDKIVSEARRDNRINIFIDESKE